GGTRDRALVSSSTVDRRNCSDEPTHPSIIERDPRSRLEGPHSPRIAVGWDPDVRVDRHIQRCYRAEFDLAGICDRADSVTEPINHAMSIRSSAAAPP